MTARIGNHYFSTRPGVRSHPTQIRATLRGRVWTGRGQSLRYRGDEPTDSYGEGHAAPPGPRRLAAPASRWPLLLRGPDGAGGPDAGPRCDRGVRHRARTGAQERISGL